MRLTRASQVPDWRNTGRDALLISTLGFLSLFVLANQSSLFATVFSDSYRFLSMHPFESHSDLRRRFLLPLILGSIGLGDDRMGFGLAFLTFSFLLLLAYYVRLFAGYRATIFTVLSIAFLPLTEFGIVSFSWPDISMYVCFMAVLCMPLLEPLWIVLGIMFHESFIFLVPGLVLLPRAGITFTHVQRFTRLAMYGLTALMTLAARERYFNQNHEAFAVGTYWDILKFHIFEHYWAQPIVLSTLVAFKAGIIIFFFALVSLLKKEGIRSDLPYLILQFLSVFVALSVAADTTRIVSLAFPVILWSYLRLREWPVLLGLTAVIHLLTPSCFISPQWFAHFRIVPTLLDDMVFGAWHQWLFRPL